MNTDHSLLSSPAMLGADAALKRASLRARELARSTGTACWISENGRLVDVAKSAASPRSEARVASRRKGG